MIVPSSDEVLEYFRGVVVVRCLRFGVAVNIDHVKKFTLSESGDRYYAGNKLICVWDIRFGYSDVLRCDKLMTKNKKKCE